MLITEPIFVPDVYCTSLHDVENLEDGNYRFTLLSRQRQEHVVVSRLILPSSAIFVAVKLTLRSLGAKCCGAGINRITN